MAEGHRHNRVARKGTLGRAALVRRESSLCQLELRHTRRCPGVGQRLAGPLGVPKLDRHVSKQPEKWVLFYCRQPVMLEQTRSVVVQRDAISEGGGLFSIFVVTSIKAHVVSVACCAIWGQSVKYVYLFFVVVTEALGGACPE